MFKNNLLMLLGAMALLTLLAVAVSRKLPRPLGGVSESGRYQPVTLTDRTFHPDSLNMLDRQVPMQVL